MSFCGDPCNDIFIYGPSVCEDCHWEDSVWIEEDSVDNDSNLEGDNAK